MNKFLGNILVPAAVSCLMMGTATATKLQPTPSLSKDEMAKSSVIYFDRCSGCHGVLRGGATGPNITPEKTLKKKLSKLEKILYEGTDGGMPGWGKDGYITKSETKMLLGFGAPSNNSTMFSAVN